MTGPGVVRGHELPRKTLHFSTAAIPVALWLGVPQRHVAAMLVALFGVACVVELARRRSATLASHFDSTVGVMLRPHEAANGITGATWLLATFAITCLAAPLNAAIAATWAGAVGDGMATVAGRAWRRRHSGSGKTLAGSVVCAFAAAFGAWWLAAFTWPVAVGIGVIAATVERPDVALDDNVRVTGAVALAAAALLALLRA